MSSILRNILVLLFIVTVSIVVTFYINKKPPLAPKDITDALSNHLDIQSISDELIKIDLKQKTILHFWATWCAPCIKELPELYDYSAKHPNIQIVTIAVQDNTDKINAFVQKNRLKNSNIIQTVDPDWKITKTTFQIKKLPSTVFIQDYKIVKRVNGPVNWLDYIAFLDQ